MNENKHKTYQKLIIIIINTINIFLFHIFYFIFFPILYFIPTIQTHTHTYSHESIINFPRNKIIDYFINKIYIILYTYESWCNFVIVYIHEEKMFINKNISVLNVIIYNDKGIIVRNTFLVTVFWPCIV